MRLPGRVLPGQTQHETGDTAPVGYLGLDPVLALHQKSGDVGQHRRLPLAAGGDRGAIDADPPHIVTSSDQGRRPHVLGLEGRTQDIIDVIVRAPDPHRSRALVEGSPHRVGLAGRRFGRPTLPHRLGFHRLAVALAGSHRRRPDRDRDRRDHQQTNRGPKVPIFRKGIGHLFPP